jgi:hypothetical protein
MKAMLILIVLMVPGRQRSYESMGCRGDRRLSE